MDSSRILRKVLWVIIFLSFFSNVSRADIADSLLIRRNEVCIRFPRPEGYDLRQLTGMMSIARVEDDSIEAFLNHSQWRNFKLLHIPYRVVFSEKKLVQRNYAAWSYPTEREYMQMMWGFGEQYPSVCHIYEVGQSVKGKPILFARINADTLRDKPAVMLTSTMHGNETGGMVLMLRLIEYLLGRRGSDSLVKKLTDSLDIWINPLSNPDGMYFDSTDVREATRFNANGIDLNRNFPDPVMGLHPDGNEYQPETQAMMFLMQRYRFVMSANFHSGEEVVNYPWDSQPTRHPDDSWFRTVAKTYADTAICYGSNDYFRTYLGNSTVAGITNGYDWYPVYGGRQDYVTYFLMGREFTIEIDKDYITPENELEQLWQWNYRSILSWISYANEGIRGSVVDSHTGKPVSAQIKITGHDTEYSVVRSDSSKGVFYRLLLPGEYILEVSAPGYETYLVSSAVFAGRYTDMKIMLTPGSGVANERVWGPVIYPNCVKDKIYFSGMGGKHWRFVVMGMDGQVMSVGNLAGNELNAGYLRPGMYILLLTCGGETFRYKFLKVP